MIRLPEDLDDRFKDAIKYFWEKRNSQIVRQQETGVHDQGSRGAVTGGKQMDGFVNLVRDILIFNGVPEHCIFTNTALELPGFYRANKQWDLLVVDDQALIIAIEFKSQVGPSFGNNFNNRTEEAMGSALDLWTAYREGVFGVSSPWLGYFFVMEECTASKKPVRAAAPHFPVLEEFVGASYIERYEIFCRKLLLERQYNGACFTTTSCMGNSIFYDIPNPELSYIVFINSMLVAARAYFNRQGGI